MTSHNHHLQAKKQCSTRHMRAQIVRRCTLRQLASLIIITHISFSTSPSSNGAEYRPNLSSSSARSFARQNRSLACQHDRCHIGRKSKRNHLSTADDEIEHIDDHVVVIEQIR